jgi:hypothetical protein
MLESQTLGILHSIASLWSDGGINMEVFEDDILVGLLEAFLHEVSEGSHSKSHLSLIKASLTTFDSLLMEVIAQPHVSCASCYS